MTAENSAVNLAADMASAFLTLHNQSMYEEMMYIAQAIKSIIPQSDEVDIMLNHAVAVKERLVKLLRAYTLLGPDETCKALNQMIGLITDIEDEIELHDSRP